MVAWESGEGIGTGVWLGRGIDGSQIKDTHYGNCANTTCMFLDYEQPNSVARVEKVTESNVEYAYITDGWCGF